MRISIVMNAALAAFLCMACDAGPRAGGSPLLVGGRFLAQRVAKRVTTLTAGPAQASYCPADSLLVVIAIGRDWTGGFAVQAVLPLREARTFRVQRSLDSLGSATVAFRPLGEGTAQLAVSGTLRLEASSAVSGEFAVAAPDSSGVRVSFQGRWSHIPLETLPKGSCWSL